MSEYWRDNLTPSPKIMNYHSKTLLQVLRSPYLDSVDRGSQQFETYVRFDLLPPFHKNIDSGFSALTTIPIVGESTGCRLLHPIFRKGNGTFCLSGTKEEHVMTTGRS